MSVTFSYAARVRDSNVAAVNQRLATGDFMGAPSYRALKQKGGVRGVRGRGQDVRKMVMEIGGVGSFNAELLIPQMFLMPRTTDPEAQATILTVEGVQRALARVGSPVDVSGLLDPATVQGLRRVSGASWMSKTWLQIYGDFGDMIARGKRLGPAVSLGDTIIIDRPTARRVELGGDPFTTIPAAALVGGALLLFYALK